LVGATVPLTVASKSNIAFMGHPVVIAVDAMGGDHGPTITVPAALEALREDRDLRIVLVGQSAALQPLIGNQPFADRLRVKDAAEVVTMDERPQDALRKKKNSSLRISIDLVKEGQANACISSGNSGALMATARFVLKMLPGIDRPAMLSRIPAHHGHTVMLDLGANADCTPEQLFQFAVMGTAIAKELDGDARPRVGLLNIGEEDIKGNEIVQQAHKLLGLSTLNYIGFVEGNDIFGGEVDVVVTDGFTGNVALKSMEGIAMMFVDTLKSEYSRTPLRKLAALASRAVIEGMRKRLDPREHNGASLVGLNGVVVKSHGSADAYAFANALRVAVLEARRGVPTQIVQLLQAEAQRAQDRSCTLES